MKLTIHIGTTKTGSTSIQAFLAQNHDALRKQAVLYPTGLGPKHHVKATVAALSYGTSPDLFRFCGITDNLAHEEFRAQMSHTLAQQVAQAGSIDHVIISSEHLHSRCVSPEDIQRFQYLFCQGFDETEVVVYVRPQIDHMVSLFSTNLRHGFNGTLDDHITAMLGAKHTSYFNLKDVITRWVNVFGKTAVTVRPFAALNRKSGGAVADFCRVAKIAADGPDMLPVAAHNVEINAKGQELLMILNQNKGIPAPIRRKAVAWLEKEFNGRGLKPTPEMVQTVQAQFSQSNAWVTDTYFSKHPEYLAPAVRKDPVI